MIPSGSIREAFRRMPHANKDYLDGAGIYLRWRHQDVGNRRPESDNAAGIDPYGTTFETQDYHKKARKQGTRFYTDFVPVEGDLLITLRGGPTTKQAAQNALPSGYYRVVGVDARRTDEGKLIYCRVSTEADHSGQW